MGFNKDVVAKVKEEYSDKYRRAQDASDARRNELHAKIPSLRLIDKELSLTGLKIMEVALKKEGDVHAKIDEIRQTNDKLLVERAAILKVHGYPEDYTDAHYECEKCGDSGYIGTTMCDCMKKALVLASYESSGVGELIKHQSFENFSLEYYRQTPEIYENMKRIYEITKNFAENFSADTYKNFLYLGGTGLGKTHISTAVAKTVIDRHFDVLYATATGMIGDFEQKRFGNSAIEGDVQDTSRYYTADLLIIDDLGTEVSNQFTVSCLYDVINSRIMSRKSTVISTNFGRDELRKHYAERITSRIFGEYKLLLFKGTDVRRQKIEKK